MMRQFAVEEVERAIRKRANSERARELAATIRSRAHIAGLSREDLIDILRELKPTLPEVEEEFIWLNFLQDLWGSEYFEARLLGLQLMYYIPDLVDAHLWGMLDHWTSAVDNWVLADWLGHVRAIAIHKNPSLVMRMAPWLQSVDPWRRRSAIVSLVYIDPQSRERQLLLGAQEIFAFLEPVIEERHLAVQAAMSWLLRQVESHYPEDFAEFLEQHRSRLPKVVLTSLHNKQVHSAPA
ncbi:MAG: DNA alkylation repair protein [candidate division KSB1 bacterium]|nr:DNA alkylation repair protein [candidate division KSB1 bacterium]MDQ7065748.1 DNA alkylation repair protein [candidate division KSB1 bacterium]